jgi:putative MATE family efflux protein
MAPPVMLSQLIQALYNIVDSYFVGSYSTPALTALSVVYPLQWLSTAMAVGLGTGVNTYSSRLYALGEDERARKAGGTGMLLEIIVWALYSLFIIALLPTYVRLSANGEEVISDSLTYGYIVCVGSIGLFLESNWTKILQARGEMAVPMVAQVSGALTNIVFDPLLIYGIGPFPALGVKGAAIATVMGQCVAVLVVCPKGFRKSPRKLSEFRVLSKNTLRLAYPSMLSQATMSVYIIVLNLILASFSDAAVTVLGLYYKYQSFFFIPLLALQTCVVPIISYNYAAGNHERCKESVNLTLVVASFFMLIGMFCFIGIPRTILSVFTRDEEVLAVGIPAFRLIGSSFISAVFSLTFPVFFQAVGQSFKSTMIALTRQIFCLIPFFYILSKISLTATWAAFPLSETTAGVVGLICYVRELGKWKKQKEGGKTTAIT